MSLPGRVSGLALSLVVTGIGILLLTASASNEPDCDSPGDAEIEVCGEILEHWQDNGAESTFGYPLTDEKIELDPDTNEEIVVQYFEQARLEFHPELANTPYAVQSGRLGAELLHAQGTDWRDLSQDGGSGDDVFDTTSQAIAPEFEPYWREHGIDLGDDSDPFEQSLALHGYPIGPPEAEVDDEQIERVQWFERTRLELRVDGSVTAAPVGKEATESVDHLSVRAEREISTALDGIAREHDSRGLGVWIDSPHLGHHAWTVGEANPETGEPYTLDTHHRIGSVTKPFVAEVILQLVDDGVIDLDDTVDKWFPELEGAEDITIRMLGNMTSGIFNYTEALVWISELMDDPEALREPEELIRFGFELTDDVNPGAEWSYSNTNYVMLGLIIEDVTGNDLADELEDRIFDPLGLESTAFADSDDPTLPEPYARARTSMGLGSSARDSTDWNPSWAWAAGQIYSTPEDMLRWLPDVYQSSLLSTDLRDQRLDLIDIRPADLQEELAATDEAAATEVGYGFGVLMTGGWYGHDGLIAGYATMVAYHPELDASLVIVANSDEIGPDGTLVTGKAYDTIQNIIEREVFVLPAD